VIEYRIQNVHIQLSTNKNKKEKQIKGAKCNNL
jgi:hypothetical protein